MYWKSVSKDLSAGTAKMTTGNTNISVDEVKNLGRGDAYNDERLHDCFLDTPEYKLAEKGEILIVQGGKGSGKSAILKFIDQKCSRNKDLYFSLLLADKDYKKGTFGDATLPELNEKKIAQLWTSNLWVELIKRINVERDNFPPEVGTNLDRIGNLIKYNTEVNQDFIPRFVRFLKRIVKVEIPYFGGGIELKEIPDRFVTKLDATIPHVKNILKTKKVYLLIDDTDSFLDVLHLKYNFISGLIGAADGLRDEFRDLKDLIILISVRSDMLSEISMTYDKINNLRDFIAQLRWDKNNLKNLITDRIKKPYNLECDADTAWNMLFDEYMDPRDKVSTFDYILERTFYRPRDMIQFCNLALEKAKAHKNKKITEQNIREAEETYSRQKYEDISAEYLHKYGERLSDSVLGPFRQSKANLSTFDLENTILNKIMTSVTQPSWLTRETTKEDIKEMMYKMGILGVKEGSRYVFSFQEEVKDLSGKEFQIHKAFHRHLNIQS